MFRWDGRTAGHGAILPHQSCLRFKQCRVKRWVVYDLLQNHARDCTLWTFVSFGYRKIYNFEWWYVARWNVKFSPRWWDYFKTLEDRQGFTIQPWIHCPRRIERSDTKVEIRYRDDLFDRGSSSEVERFVGVPGSRDDPRSRVWACCTSLRYLNRSSPMLDKSLGSSDVYRRCIYL